MDAHHGLTSAYATNTDLAGHLRGTLRSCRLAGVSMDLLLLVRRRGQLAALAVQRSAVADSGFDVGGRSRRSIGRGGRERQAQAEGHPGRNGRTGPALL